MAVSRTSGLTSAPSRPGLGSAGARLRPEIATDLRFDGPSLLGKDGQSMTTAPETAPELGQFGFEPASVGKYSGAVFRDMLVVQDAGFAAACAPCSWRLNDLSMIRTLGPSRRTQAFCPAM
jgi:hypothetical protein